MKKLIYLFIMASVLLVSCQNKNYSIKGTVADAAYEGTNVYLQEMTDDAMVVTDTAIVQNGEFSFSGVADTTYLRFVTLDENVNYENEIRVPVLIEPGKLKLVFDSVITVSGTPVNDAYNNLRVEQRVLVSNIRKVVDRYNTARAEGSMTDALDAEINAEYDKISDQLTDLNYNFVKNNIGNQLGQYVFISSSSMFEPIQQKEILYLADESFKSTENVKRIAERLESLDKVAVGKKFADFTLKDPEGNDVSLSDYAGQGKYVFVDFWAAWCGPCRQEMPNVVAAYEKYKSKGLEIVGVSFDQDYETWTKGIKDLNMTWPQMSDLQYWDSPVIDLYAIIGIPHTVLLDKDGVIIEKDLRGDALDAKLAELMP
ncbi:MAG: TlpA disulfide reductase family protein [Fermentimonas sp.]|nr:TlpA disulfide reductase family protein [Fermentimonas sp.]